MKIACDTQIAFRTIEYLNNMGHTVVYRATNEMDNEWFENALNKGAELFISPDIDIDVLCNRHNIKSLKIPKGLKAKELNVWLKKKLKTVN